MRKKMISSFSFALVCLLSVSILVAQERTVTGTVTDDEGNPLAGVSVSTKGKGTQGTITDKNGAFTIEVPTDQSSIVLSSVGFAQQRVRVGPNSGGIGTIRMIVQRDELEEVVVTALGISRNKKALGYAVTDIDGDAFDRKPEADFGKLLSGKAPGLSINSTNGMTGSGVNLNIRGFSSITGGSTPLIVLNGVPFNANTNTPGTQGFLYGSSSSNRLLDIDPSSIIDVSVLKGLSATALYGELGRNGVILVTTKNSASALSTKKAAKGIGATVTQSINITEVSQIPETQSSWGGGFHNVSNAVFFSNWGGRTDIGTKIAHPYNKGSSSDYATIFPQFLGDKTYEYKNYNSVKKFFSGVGIASNTGISIDAGNQDLRVNANFSYLDDKGFIETNLLKRFNFGTGFYAKLNHGFSIQANMNYVSSDFTTPPISYSAGSSSRYGPSLFGDVMYTPLTIDLKGLPYESPVDQSSVYYRNNNGIQNPLWTIYNAKLRDVTDRTYGNIQLSNSDLVKHMTFSYRIGWDYYSQQQQNSQNKGGRPTANLSTLGRGYLRTTMYTNFTMDHLALAGYSNQFGEDISLTAQVGFNYTYRSSETQGTYSAGQIVYGLLDHSNFEDHDNIDGITAVDLGGKSERYNLGVFYDVSLGYKDGLYLNLLGRYGQSSTLPQKNSTIFYPSVSVSFVPTTIIKALAGKSWLNFLKLRVGYASSANFPSPYRVRQGAVINSKIFVTSGNSSINTGQLSSRKANPDLKPELVQEYEAGVEAKFLSSRISLDFTFFYKESTDQILTKQLSTATGFASQLVNRGGIRNTGYEVNLGFVPVQTADWRVALNLIFYSYRNSVFGLNKGEKILLRGFTNLGAFAINGQPLSVLQGTYFTTEKGERIVNKTGNYVASTKTKIIADPNPDFQLNTILSVSYKGLSLGVQFDYKQGGQVYSTTARSMLARGLAKETDIDRAQSVILKGVIKDATGKYVPNNIQISTTEAYFQNGFGPHEISVYSATLLRLRDISLSYTLPEKVMSKIKVLNSVSLGVSMSNLWYYAPGFPEGYNVDTDVNAFGSGTSARGIEALTGPSARKYSFNLRITL